MQARQDTYGFSNFDKNVDAGIDPKLSYRFKVAFIGMAGRTDHTRQMSGYVNTVRLPSFSQNEVEINAYVSKYYVIGKHTIGDLEIEFRNDINGNVSSVIQTQIDSQYNAQRQSHSPAAESVKFMVKVMYLDGDNTSNKNVYEGFIYTGCWLKNVDWGSLDYTSSNPVTISVTIRPDNFYHVIGGLDSGMGGLLSDEDDVHIGQSTANIIQLDDAGVGSDNDRGA